MTGVAGVLMVSKAVYVRPQEILKTTYHYGHIGWVSNETISSIAKPKADVSISVVAVILAFMIRFVSLIFVDTKSPFVDSKFQDILLAVALVSVGSLVPFHVHRGIYGKNMEQIKCTEASNFLERGLVKELSRQQSGPL